MYESIWVQPHDEDLRREDFCICVSFKIAPSDIFISKQIKKHDKWMCNNKKIT